MTNPRNTPAGENSTALLSTARLDALREVANIGAGHAATALSTLTATRIMISVPMVNIVPPGDYVPEIAPGVEIVAVRMAMTGDIGGQTVFLLAIPAGLRLAERMLRRKRGTSPSLGRLEQSALNEAGNILAGAYLTALSEFLDMRLMLSPPSLTTGPTSEALATLGDHAPRVDSPILCVETEFFLEEPAESLHGFFLLVPNPKAFDAIFRAVRVE
ncbi:MAG: chemotaxis protein CheC [Gemmatimonadaceae bacterium]